MKEKQQSFTEIIMEMYGKDRLPQDDSNISPQNSPSNSAHGDVQAQNALIDKHMETLNGAIAQLSEQLASMQSSARNLLDKRLENLETRGMRLQEQAENAFKKRGSDAILSIPELPICRSGRDFDE